MPMYLFLSHLAFVDIGYSTSVTPIMLMSFLRERTAIPVTGCIAQLGSDVTFGTTECFLLATIAYNHYGSICSPLLYSIHTSPVVCFFLLEASYLGGCAYNPTGAIILGQQPAQTLSPAKRRNSKVRTQSDEEKDSHRRILDVEKLVAGEGRDWEREKVEAVAKIHDTRRTFWLGNGPKKIGDSFMVEVRIAESYKSIVYEALLSTKLPLYLKEHLKNAASQNPVDENKAILLIFPSYMQIQFGKERDKNAFVKTCTTMVIIPHVLVDLLSDSNNCFIMAAMSYDCYTAIHNPLHYSILMTHKICFQRMMAAWVVGFLVSVCIVLIVFNLSFCDSNTFQHFFCDISPVVCLACDYTPYHEMAIFLLSAIVFVDSFIFIMISCVFNGSIVMRMPSAQGRGHSQGHDFPRLPTALAGRLDVRGRRAESGTPPWLHSGALSWRTEGGVLGSSVLKPVLE
eukprot:bmy_21508T0